MGDLCNLSLVEAAGAVRRGEISSQELTQACLERIAECEPAINAFLHLEAEFALSRAKAADQALARGDHTPGLLHGVPVARKDLFSRQGQRATCGSRLRKDIIAGHTATCLERMDAAGAVDLGGLNMSEFAYHLHGLNRLAGPARNPWDTTRSAGGSSGGSAAALAARMLFAALGSDTGGSIRSPAALSGVVGLLPTRGRVSRYGMMQTSPSLDAVGPMARDVRDCGRLLSVVAGHDERDPSSAIEPVPDYEAEMRKSVRNQRLGVLIVGSTGALLPDALAALNAAMQCFEDAGVFIEEIALPGLDDVNHRAAIILAREAALTHKRDLRTRSEEYTAAVRERLAAGVKLSEAVYLRALQERERATAEFCDAVFHKVDALLLPAAPGVACPLDQIETQSYLPDDGGIDVSGVVAEPGTYTRAFNYLGLPALVLPCGHTAAGLPLGMQLVGRPFDESLLFRLGAAYQNNTEYHLASPNFVNSRDSG